MWGCRVAGRETLKSLATLGVSTEMLVFLANGGSTSPTAPPVGITLQEAPVEGEGLSVHSTRRRHGAHRQHAPRPHSEPDDSAQHLDAIAEAGEAIAALPPSPPDTQSSKGADATVAPPQLPSTTTDAAPSSSAIARVRSELSADEADAMIGSLCDSPKVTLTDPVSCVATVTGSAVTTPQVPVQVSPVVTSGSKMDIPFTPIVGPTMSLAEFVGLTPLADGDGDGDAGHTTAAAVLGTHSRRSSDGSVQSIGEKVGSLLKSKVQDLLGKGHHG